MPSGSQPCQAETKTAAPTRNSGICHAFCRGSGAEYLRVASSAVSVAMTGFPGVRSFPRRVEPLAFHRVKASRAERNRTHIATWSSQPPTLKNVTSRQISGQIPR